MAGISRAAGFAGALLLALPPAAWTLDENQQFRTLGVGAAPCSRYSELRTTDNPNASAAFGIWAAGFLTSHNLLSRDTYDYLGTTSEQEVMAGLDRYCAEMPDQPFVFALVRYLSEDLRAQRLERRPSPRAEPQASPAR